MKSPNLIKEPFTFPCGATVKNRLCKAAMGENLAKDDLTSPELVKLYETWSKGGAGILITGNVMVDTKAKTSRNTLAYSDNDPLLKELAKKAQQAGSALWMQINHPGRQAPKFNDSIVGPSAIGLEPSSVFAVPKALKEDEIWSIIERFGKVALGAKEAGFSGVQIHGAHGYLVSQFLSGRTNIRKDQWGGSMENRARFAREIYKNIRSKVGDNFPISIKINSADFQKGAFSEDESLQVIKWLSEDGIDLIEVSGGTYEKAAMMGQELRESTKKREAYFSDFIVKARKVTNTPLMLTGGFRTMEAMEEALENNELDIIGMARPFARNINVANDFLEGKITEHQVPLIKVGIQLIDKKGFLDTKWHTEQLIRIGHGKKPNLKMSGWKPFLKTIVEAFT
jgi:2,4-dienoyl-CoA reductase-like NADH-dependent reductase (Old Yellow Enzyme family)